MNNSAYLNNIPEEDLLGFYLEDIMYYIDGVASAIVIICGLLGNVLSAIILTRRSMLSTTNTFLTALTVWDTTVLLGSLLLIVLPTLSPRYMEEAMSYIVVYIYPLALIAQTSATWITVSLMILRYIAIRQPLHASTLCTVLRARIAIILISCIGVLFNAARWFEFRITTDITQGNQSNPNFSFMLTDFGKNSTYKTVFYVLLYPLVMLVLPCAFLVILTGLIIHALKKSHMMQKSMNVTQARENNVTKMLVSVVAVFVFCQIPALVYNIAYALRDDIALIDGWMILSTVRNFLITFNSAVNFVLYCVFVKKFRRIFTETFLDRSRKEGLTKSQKTAQNMYSQEKQHSPRNFLLPPNIDLELTDMSRLSPSTPTPPQSPWPNSSGQEMEFFVFS